MTGVQTIGELAFGGTENAIIYVPKSATSIGTGAFLHTPQIYYSGSLNTIGFGAKKIN